MPPYTSYGKNDKHGREWILIQNHPLCKLKNFYVKKYGSIENTKEAVRQFLKNLEESGVPHNSNRKKYTKRPKEKKENEEKLVIETAIVQNNNPPAKYEEKRHPLLKNIIRSFPRRNQN